MAPLIIEAARRHILELDAKQLFRFEQFLVDCSFELADNPTRKEVEQNCNLVRSAADVFATFSGLLRKPPIALAALNSKVDYFVTYDRDFTDEDETTENIRQALPGIMMPPVFLREVMGWTSEELELIRNRNWEDFNFFSHRRRCEERSKHTEVRGNRKIFLCFRRSPLLKSQVLNAVVSRISELSPLRA